MSYQDLIFEPSTPARPGKHAPTVSVYRGRFYFNKAARTAMWQSLAVKVSVASGADVVRFEPYEFMTSGVGFRRLTDGTYFYDKGLVEQAGLVDGKYLLAMEKNCVFLDRDNLIDATVDESLPCVQAFKDFKQSQSTEPVDSVRLFNEQDYQKLVDRETPLARVARAALDAVNENPDLLGHVALTLDRSRIRRFDKRIEQLNSELWRVLRPVYKDLPEAPKLQRNETFSEVDSYGYIWESRQLDGGWVKVSYVGGSDR